MLCLYLTKMFNNRWKCHKPLKCVISNKKKKYDHLYFLFWPNEKRVYRNMFWTSLAASKDCIFRFNFWHQLDSDIKSEMSHIDPETELLYMPSNWVVRVPPEQSVPLHVKVSKHSLFIITPCESQLITSYKFSKIQSKFVSNILSLMRWHQRRAAGWGTLWQTRGLVSSTAQAMETRWTCLGRRGESPSWCSTSPGATGRSCLGRYLPTQSSLWSPLVTGALWWLIASDQLSPGWRWLTTRGVQPRTWRGSPPSWWGWGPGYWSTPRPGGSGWSSRVTVQAPISLPWCSPPTGSCILTRVPPRCSKG